MPGEKCPDCNGKGYEEVKETVTIKVPAGVDTENRLRVSGKGNIGRSGSRGDLYVTFIVEEDKTFIRNGNDVYIEVPVFFTQAVMGETIKIPSLTGELELKLDIGTRDKQQFTFRGEGIEDVHGHGKGSLIAQVSLTYPKKLTDEQYDLLDQLQESFGVESKPHENLFESAFERERRFSSDAAHELRTPVSLIRARIRVEGGRACIDFRGSAPVHRGNINATEAIVRFLDDVRAERLECLLAIPRATVRAEQGLHQLDELRQRLTWFAHAARVAQAVDGPQGQASCSRCSWLTRKARSALNRSSTQRSACWRVRVTRVRACSTSPKRQT